jgi:hypothetical protein
VAEGLDFVLQKIAGSYETFIGVKEDVGDFKFSW